MHKELLHQWSDSVVWNLCRHLEIQDSNNCFLKTSYTGQLTGLVPDVWLGLWKDVFWVSHCLFHLTSRLGKVMEFKCHT